MFIIQEPCHVLRNGVRRNSLVHIAITCVKSQILHILCSLSSERGLSLKRLNFLFRRLLQLLLILLFWNRRFSFRRRTIVWSLSVKSGGVGSLRGVYVMLKWCQALFESNWEQLFVLQWLPCTIISRIYRACPRKSPTIFNLVRMLRIILDYSS